MAQCFTEQVNQAKEAMRLFNQDSISLKGEYPAVPPEVMAVFAAPNGIPIGMLDGKIDQADITIDSAIIADIVYDAFFQPIFGTKFYMPGFAYHLFCLLYMADKADDIYDIIGDTDIFELPSLQQDTTSSSYGLNYDKLKGVMDKLGDELESLWPDDEDEESQDKHGSQTNDLTKLEKELKKVMEFITNPFGPLDAEWDRTLKKIKDLQKQLQEFNSKLAKAAKNLSKLDLSMLADLNDIITKEVADKLPAAVKSCCTSMIGYFKNLQAPLRAKMDAGTATAEEEEEFFRLAVNILDLTELKNNPKPMRDYVNSYIKDKDIEALTYSAKHKKMIIILSRISINYQQDLMKLAVDQSSMSLTGLSSYNKKLGIIEGQRFCNCIRTFNKMKKTDSNIKDLFYQGVLKYSKSYFSEMHMYEVQMLASCIDRKVPAESEILNVNSLDRLNSLATDITDDAKTVIDASNTSEATVVNGVKDCVAGQVPSVPTQPPALPPGVDPPIEP